MGRKTPRISDMAYPKRGTDFGVAETASDPTIRDSGSVRQGRGKVKTLLKKTSLHQPIGYVVRKFKRAFRRLSWLVAPALTWRSSNEKDRRLLIIYDFSAQPYSIGDILILQEASLVLRENFDVHTVDFAFVYDPKEPTNGDPAFVNITEENCLFNLASILPIAQVNPYLGSVFLFNSHAHLERFVIDNYDRYHVWPSAGEYIEKKYMYYDVFNTLLFNYYKERKTIPYLNSRPPLLSWANGFLREHILPSVPVTVQLRRNPVNKRRNSHYESWFTFFEYCENVYPATFVIICSKSETDERLRKYSNVLIAKDYYTSIEQDLALINASAIHMGAGSGPGAIAVFGAKPFCLFNTGIIWELHRGKVQEGDSNRMFFSSRWQNLFSGQETSDLLINEFKRMWSTVDLDYWKHTS